MSLSALFARGASPSAAAAAGERPGRTFLQVMRYDRMPEKFYKPYFDAIDKHYMPALAKAPGLLMLRRFPRYDLPEKIGIHLWESEQARDLWKKAMQDVPPGLSAEYHGPMHSFAHDHYILEASFKG